jgi:hypothetical protein
VQETHEVTAARHGETDRPDTVEIGVTVTDRWQRHGIARLHVVVISKQYEPGES